jgi:hypothetical protein
VVAGGSDNGSGNGGGNGSDGLMRSERRKMLLLLRWALILKNFGE